MPALPTFAAPPVNCGSDELLVALAVLEVDTTAGVEGVDTTGARVEDAFVEVLTVSSDVEEEPLVALPTGVSAGKSEEILAGVSTGTTAGPVGEGTATVGASGIRETEMPNC